MDEAADRKGEDSTRKDKRNEARKKVTKDKKGEKEEKVRTRKGSRDGEKISKYEKGMENTVARW